MINTAIKSAYALIPVPPSGIYIPFMVYNTSTSLFDMYYPIEWVDVYPYTNVTIPHLYFNDSLNWYFQSLPTLTFSNQSPLDNLMICENTLLNTGFFPPSTTKAAIIMRQEYNTAALTSSLTNISISSNNLGCVPVNVCTTPFGGSSTSTSTAISIIEDFDINNNDIVGDQRSYQNYTSQNFRYSNLLDKKALYNINLSFYIYSQEKNDFYHIYIPPHFVLGIKLMFKKKSLMY